MWLYVRCILIPRQKIDAIAHQIPRGSLSDLYPRWLGARELLLHGRDPYRDDITREIQTGYYGRVLDASRPNDPKDQQAFAYPVYVAFVLAPTVRLPFPAVQDIFLALLALLTALSIPFWLRALQWRVTIGAEITGILLVLSCFPAIQGLRLQQLSLLVIALIAASMSAISRRHFSLGGALLAVATIKPQLVVILVLWLSTWTAGNWRSRYRVLLSFIITTAALVIAGEAILPGWIHEFRAAMASYYRYTGGGKSVLDVFLTPAWGRLASAVVVGAFVWFSWRMRNADEGTSEFRYSLGQALATTLLVIPMFAPYNQLLLVPPLMILVRSIRKLWQKSSLLRVLLTLTTISVIWPFLAAAVLVFALVIVPVATVQKGWALPLYTSFDVPVLVYATLLVSRWILLGDRNVLEPHGLRQGAASE